MPRALSTFRQRDVATWVLQGRGFVGQARAAQKSRPQPRQAKLVASAILPLVKAGAGGLALLAALAGGGASAGEFYGGEPVDNPIILERQGVCALLNYKCTPEQAKAVIAEYDREHPLAPLTLPPPNPYIPPQSDTQRIIELLEEQNQMLRDGARR